MEWALMVVAIVAITTWAKVHKARLGIREDERGNPVFDPNGGRDAEALRDEVRTLKERIAVLERIAVEKENTLARQIDELRDR